VPQTTLSVVLEVAPDSTDVLTRLIEQVRKDQEDLQPGETEPYTRLKQGVPTLHFMSLSVFRDCAYDPIFVIEANFDGPPGPFWAALEEILGSRLRLMLRCCKRPADSSGPLYDAVTGRGAVVPVAAYLERRTLTPSVFFHGNRGLDRARILEERALFLATRAELDGAATRHRYRAMKTAEEIHGALRTALGGRFALDKPAPPRIPSRERFTDIAKLFGFIVAVLYVLSLPGLALATAMPVRNFLVLFAAAGALVAFLLYRIRAPRPGEAAPRRRGGLTPASLSRDAPIASAGNPFGLLLWVVLVLAAYTFVAALVIWIGAQLLGWITVLIFGGARFDQSFWSTVVYVLLGLYSLVVFTIPAVVLWLRWLERRDSSHDAPSIDARELRKMTRREDWIPQNHMGSVVLVKPGVLRMALFRAGHLGLGLVLRVVATNGYLGSMRTVHFAHWAFVNNGSRLMFFSNFDHSWDSYLDDFIEKAHGGLTLAWGSGVGFPPARFLVLDGASHGRQFKTWARHSMAVSRFWFSAYRDLTVDQIERNARMAEGLRKPRMTAAEATAWARDL
jgi:hypothetical protein